jgi:hypothetical protein
MERTTGICMIWTSEKMWSPLSCEQTVASGTMVEGAPSVRAPTAGVYALQRADKFLTNPRLGERCRATAPLLQSPARSMPTSASAAAGRLRTSARIGRAVAPFLC